MTILTLLRYLIGDREAILEIASNRHALWIGLLFVLSAGFAREYDGEDLLHEPWYLVLPLAASLVASLVLFWLFREFSNIAFGSYRAFWSAYLSFLGLFWMTAPLAWLYAIPYERYVDAHLAIDLNLYTLGLVAAWRVALMIRVLSVCSTMHPAAVAGVVVGFGVATFAAANLFTTLPLLATMGGLRTFEEKTALQQFVEGAAICPPVLVGLLCLVGLLVYRALTPANKWIASVDMTSPRPRADLIGLCVLSLVVWIVVLPHTQPEQQRRRAVELAVRQGRYHDAVAHLTLTPREDFPPHWDPPPRVVGGCRPVAVKSAEELLGIAEAARGTDLPDWVRDYYTRRLSWLIRSPTDYGFSYFLASRLPDIPEGMALLAEAEADTKIDEWQKSHFQRLRVLMAEIEQVKKKPGGR